MKFKLLTDFDIEIKKGSLITGKTLIPGLIPVIAGGKFPAYFHNEANRTGPVITVSASGANAGYAAFHKTKIFASDCSTIESGNKCDLKFVFYALKSKQNKLYASQTGGAQPHVHPKDIAKIEILDVPLPEQRRIAAILTDLDDLIETQEALIAKKKAIKEATMELLLTGKKRLPGFGGKFDLKSLGEISICMDGLRVPLNSEQRNKMKGSIPYLGANGVVDFVNDYTIDFPAILLAEDGGYFDEYKTRPIAYKSTGKAWVNNHAHILRAAGCDQDFLFYSLVHKDIRPFITNGTRAKLNKSELLKIEISLPPTIKEQVAIREVLNDLSDEIFLNETTLAKLVDQKKAVMHKLLTGEIRLPDFSESEADGDSRS